MTLDYNNHYESDEHDDHWGIIDCTDHYEPFNHDDYCDHDDFSDVP